MALPIGITPKIVTFGPAVHFDGTVAEGTVTVTAPENVVNTTTNAPLYSSQMSKRLVDGMASFSLCPTDAEGLNIKSWTYKITTVIAGALKQDDARWFLLPTAGPDEIDLDSLVTVPSSAGTPVSVQAVTVADINQPESAASVALRAAFVTVVKHGANANVARPAGAASVLWIGSVEPVNMANDVDELRAVSA